MSNDRPRSAPPNTGGFVSTRMAATNVGFGAATRKRFGKNPPHNGFQMFRYAFSSLWQKGFAFSEKMYRPRVVGIAAV